MRMPALILTVLTATLLIAPASPQDGANPSRKEQKEESAKKIKELQKERLATLEALVDATSTLFRRKLVDYPEVLEASLLLLKAELDAAEKESDRITIYQKMVEVLKQYEKIAELGKQFPRRPGDTEAAVLKIKARRLEAEINLERAKAKAAKESK